MSSEWLIASLTEVAARRTERNSLAIREIFAFLFAKAHKVGGIDLTNTTDAQETAGIARACIECGAIEAFRCLSSPALNAWMGVEENGAWAITTALALPR